MPAAKLTRFRGYLPLALATALSLAPSSSPSPSILQQSPPFARARLEPRGTVTVGQPVQLVVEVFVSTWFARAPEFPSIDIANAIATPPGRSLNLNERVNGQQYFGIRRAYTIYPQVAGTYDVPAITVTVRPGGTDDVATVSTRPASFEARIPAEAAGLDYFIGTTRLTISQSLEPQVDTLAVGDALTRTVTMTVYDALSLVLPPIAFDSIHGLALYPEPPLVTDEGGERGERIVGRRVETATYVMQEEGDYQLPAIEIAWWDLTNNRLRRSTVPAIDFRVEPNPDYVAEFAPPAEPDSAVAETAPSDSRLSRRTVLLGFTAVLALAFLLWLAHRFAPQISAALAVWLQRRRESEPTYFALFRRACRGDDPREAMQRLLAWLDRNADDGTATSIASLASAADDPELAGAVTDLSDRLYAPKERLPETRWNGRRVYQAVSRYRRRSRGRIAGRSPATRLAPLNPE